MRRTEEVYRSLTSCPSTKDLKIIEIEMLLNIRDILSDLFAEIENFVQIIKNK